MLFHSWSEILKLIFILEFLLYETGRPTLIKYKLLSIKNTTTKKQQLSQTRSSNVAEKSCYLEILCIKLKSTNTYPTVTSQNRA